MFNELFDVGHPLSDLLDLTEVIGDILILFAPHCPHEGPNAHFIMSQLVDGGLKHWCILFLLIWVRRGSWQIILKHLEPVIVHARLEKCFCRLIIILLQHLEEVKLLLSQATGQLNL
jgi:hypothetical protein